MDPFSLTAGTIQITGACAICTVTIIKWIGEVRTADQRIAGFCEEVAALQATYESLDKSLKTPAMVEAARVASKTSDGANLWEQIKTALEDSILTMTQVNKVLSEIEKRTGFGRRIKMQLLESLKEGELGRLRQRIQFFNATLSLPIQMVCLTLQLEQRGMSVDHQKQLDNKLVNLEKAIRDLAMNLTQRRRSSTIGGSTLVESSTDKLVDKDKDGMERYIDFARQFLCSASAAASTRSTMSTVSPQVEPSPLLNLTFSPKSSHSLSSDQESRVSSWIQPPPTQSPPASDIRQSMLFPHPLNTSHQSNGPTAASKKTEYKVALTLARQHLKLGHEKVAQNSHGNAEKSFRKALELFEKHGFQEELVFEPAEVILLLAKSCFMQEKYDEAVTLLTPVAEMEHDIYPRQETSSQDTDSLRRTTSQKPDRLQSLAASHMLGEVYLQKHDFDQAIANSLKAFMERLETLGQEDEKTIESVRLVIDVYTAMGDEADAEAYKVFLEAPPTAESSLESHRVSPLMDDHEMMVPPSISALDSPISLQKTAHKPSLASRVFGMRKTSQSHLSPMHPTSDPQWLAMSRTSTLENTSHDHESSVRQPDNIRSLSSPSEASSHMRSLSIYDDESTSQDSPKIDRSASTSRTLENTFKAVEELCEDRKYDRAVKIVLSFLGSYNEQKVMLVRKDEIERNIRKGGGKGLAATGKGYAPIHFFGQMKEEHLEEIALLIKHGVDVNAVAYKAGYHNTDPITPLHLAADRGHTNVARLLLDCPGIRIDTKDTDNFTPLLTACRRSNYEIVRMLLERPDPNIIPKEFPPTWYGNSLLHDASRHCDLPLVELLLSSSPNTISFEHEMVYVVNQRDKFGKTPLMHAVIKNDITKVVERSRRIKNRIPVVKLLVMAGADVNVKDGSIQAYTAREYAEKEGDEELVQLLKSLEGPYARRAFSSIKPVELLA